MKKNIKNYGYSVKERLLNLKNSKGYPYMYLLSRYLCERLLFRIANSPYRNHFLLKGGSLLYAYEGLEYRPTIDLDFLAEKLNRDRDYLIGIFAEILAIPCLEDGVTFDPDTLSAESIAVDKKYPGTRLLFTAHLDSIVHPMSIDIGFGDVVTPYPLPLDYPTLIEGLPAPNLYAYSLETLIAEKFHTMVERDESNSRMKDFFDVYQAFQNQKIDRQLLQEAIANTFANRQMHFHDSLQLFTPEFANDPQRNMMWKSFLKKIRWKQEIPFPTVMESIRENLQCYWNETLA